MYLHLGKNVVVPTGNIIGIFDIESTTLSKDTRQFLKEAEEEGFVDNLNTDIPKAFVLTEDKKKSKIFLTSVSTNTLKKRMNTIDITQ